jgi:hypothetical protein
MNLVNGHKSVLHEEWIYSVFFKIIFEESPMLLSVVLPVTPTANYRKRFTSDTSDT